MISDAHIRREVCQASASFLVQAPAGSGKTELLSQRILTLLSIVDEPEEILALTFTRKAAAEMQQRVLKSLQRAVDDAPAEKAHEQHKQALARAVLARDAERGWNLLQQPSRLRLLTLDGFCHYVVSHAPLLSGVGRQPNISNQPLTLYQNAAKKALLSGLCHVRGAQELLLHQDHQWQRSISLLADMLSVREQWLDDIAKYARQPEILREHLEHNLSEISAAHIQKCNDLCPVMLKSALPPLVMFSGQTLEHELRGNMQTFPHTSADALPQWHELGDILLTNDGKLRSPKGINKNIGFPPGTKEKEAFIDILHALELEYDFLTALHVLRKLPKSCLLDEQQWQILHTVFQVLTLANHELSQCFEQQGEYDFIHIALAAAQSLGALRHEPTALQQRLDYQIKHILLDEFQDTSELQIHILRALTEGWQADDGRSLFLVGDPMQSIYRFRKANVGLFIKAADNQLGLPHVQVASLQENFRSAPAIVTWVNHAFAHIFPSQPDAITGAIPCTPAVAANDFAGHVCVHWQVGRNDAHEAMRMLSIIRDAKSKQQRIGILARSRPHLHAIMHTLHDADIPYQAIDILPLQSRPEIRFLYALTQALLQPAHAIAWLALLRSSACGLSTLALQRITWDSHLSLWEQLPNTLQYCDAIDQQRIQYCMQALQPCIQAIGTQRVSGIIETAWKRLHIDQTLDASLIENCQQYFTLLRRIESGGSIDFNELDIELSQLYAAPRQQEGSANIELLTIHAAKGLQWDVVLLPGLGKKPRADHGSFIVKTETAVADGSWLVAAKPPTRKYDPLFSYVQYVEHEKSALETARLLYVACTRAERELHLLGHVNESKQGDYNTDSSSLFAMLWQDENHCFGATMLPIEHASEATATSPQAVFLTRMLARTIQFQAHDHAAISHSPAKASYSWAGIEAAPIGIALHAALQYLGEHGMHDHAVQTPILNTLMLRILVREGLSGIHLESATQRCREGLDRIYASKHAHFILNAKNKTDIQNEWALSCELAQGRTQHVIIDRTWVDGDGFRWIVDYKTASHAGGNIEHFLQEEQRRHQEQLDNYANILRKKEPTRIIRAALFFPFLDAWCEIPIMQNA